jgi:hypothetical protein
VSFSRRAAIVLGPLVVALAVTAVAGLNLRWVSAASEPTLPRFEQVRARDAGSASPIVEQLRSTVLAELEPIIDGRRRAAERRACVGLGVTFAIAWAAAWFAWRRMASSPAIPSDS